jgi:hypothetical protein
VAVAPVYVKLSDRKGWHVMTEEHPDGTLVVRPATSEETHQAESKGIAASDTPPPD